MRHYSLAALLAAFVLLPSLPAHAGDTYSLGVEGLYDNYKEPDPRIRVDTDTWYGSVTGNYTHTANDWMMALDGRASFGQADYSSVSGSSDNSPQAEGEARLRFGYHYRTDGGATINPYIGGGIRMYYDHSQNVVTTLGYVGYDRQIAQVYIPVGVDMAFPAGDWTIKPTAEYDQLVYGKVNSKLSQVGPTYSDISNVQHDGYGLRGSLMFGHRWMGNTWEVGPFVRYWNIDQSSTNTDNFGRRWVEPDNERYQVGAQIRVLFN